MSDKPDIEKVSRVRDYPVDLLTKDPSLPEINHGDLILSAVMSSVICIVGLVDIPAVTTILFLGFWVLTLFTAISALSLYLFDHTEKIDDRVKILKQTVKARANLNITIFSSLITLTSLMLFIGGVNFIALYIVYKLVFFYASYKIQYMIDFVYTRNINRMKPSYWEVF